MFRTFHFAAIDRTTANYIDHRDMQRQDADALSLRCFEMGMLAGGMP